MLIDCQSIAELLRSPQRRIESQYKIRKWLSKKKCFRRWRKTGRDGDDWMSDGSEFHRSDAATGKDRRPMVVWQSVGCDVLLMLCMCVVYDIFLLADQYIRMCMLWTVSVFHHRWCSYLPYFLFCLAGGFRKYEQLFCWGWRLLCSINNVRRSMAKF